MLPPIQWPTIPQPRKQPARREKSRRRQADPPTFLHRLLRRAHDRALPSATDGAIMAYDALLDRVLKDRLLDDFEADTLLPTAARWGLSNDQARLAHYDYVNRIAVPAVADGTIAEAERRDLKLVARLLDQQPPDLDEILSEAVAKVADTQIAPFAALQSAVRGLAGNACALRARASAAIMAR